MIIRFHGGDRQGRIASGSPRFNRRTRKAPMRWETPQAIDFRFGMEITMYIANR
jgi:coenzyme PQQ precursor peptide PqqA